MKLIIQIPCYNEAETLLRTLEDLPRELDGFSNVEILVIDDGSTDGTDEIARRWGVDHLVRHPRNRGLAAAFSTGIELALNQGADVIVNTDGDHQYRGESLADLLKPILAGQADMVIGDRQVQTIAHFSRTKKLLQRLGSWIVRWTSGTAVADSTSGFRAFSREAALQLMVFSTHTYTLDTIIQAGKKGLIVASVPIKTNEELRESRLIRSLPRYIARSAVAILRIFLMYEPFKVFSSLSLAPLIMALVLLIRYGYFFVIGEGAGHIQSVILGAALGIVAFQVFLLGLLSDLIAKNRQLTEELILRVKRMQLPDERLMKDASAQSRLSD